MNKTDKQYLAGEVRYAVTDDMKLDADWYDVSAYADWCVENRCFVASTKTPFYSTVSSGRYHSVIKFDEYFCKKNHANLSVFNKVKNSDVLTDEQTNCIEVRQDELLASLFSGAGGMLMLSNFPKEGSITFVGLSRSDAEQFRTSNDRYSCRDCWR